MLEMSALRIQLTLEGTSMMKHFRCLYYTSMYCSLKYAVSISVYPSK